MKSKIIQAFSQVYVSIYCYTENKGEMLIYEGNIRDIFFRAKLTNDRFTLPNNEMLFSGKLKISFQFVDL
jgi:hypothetical protein